MIKHELYLSAHTLAHTVCGETRTMDLPQESISLQPIIIKEECEPQDSLSEEEEDVNPPHPSESPCCVFCFRVQSEELLSDGPALREKIEFVLAARLRSLKVPSCRNCSQMFDLFYNFKKSCLLALSKKEELQQALVQKHAEGRYSETVRVRKPPKAKKIITCSVCSREFTDEDEHRYHINQHFGEILLRLF